MIKVKLPQSIDLFKWGDFKEELYNIQIVNNDIIIKIETPFNIEKITSLPMHNTEIAIIHFSRLKNHKEIWLTHYITAQSKNYAPILLLPTIHQHIYVTTFLNEL